MNLREAGRGLTNMDLHEGRPPSGSSQEISSLLDPSSIHAAAMSERRERRAWPCSVAAWLAKPGPTSSRDAGSWLVSKSPGELAIEVLGNVATVKVGIGDAELTAVPLERGRFAFALVNEGLLAGCAGGIGSQLTFTCSFFSADQAMECASLLAAWLNPSGSSAADVRRTLPAAEGRPERESERLLLQTVAMGNPEGAGTAWWPDFADFVANIERQWDAATTGSKPL